MSDEFDNIKTDLNSINCFSVLSNAPLIDKKISVLMGSVVDSDIVNISPLDDIYKIVSKALLSENVLLEKWFNEKIKDMGEEEVFDVVKTYTKSGYPNDILLNFSLRELVFMVVNKIFESIDPKLISLMLANKILNDYDSYEGKVILIYGFISDSQINFSIGLNKAADRKLYLEQYLLKNYKPDFVERLNKWDLNYFGDNSSVVLNFMYNIKSQIFDLYQDIYSSDFITNQSDSVGDEDDFISQLIEIKNPYEVLSKFGVLNVFCPILNRNGVMKDVSNITKGKLRKLIKKDGIISEKEGKNIELRYQNLGINFNFHNVNNIGYFEYDPMLLKRLSVLSINYSKGMSADDFIYQVSLLKQSGGDDKIL